VWCSKEQKEKQHRIGKEAEKQKEYSKYVIAEDNIRCEMHEQEKRERAQKEMDVMMENLRLAEERSIRRQEDDRRDKELEAAETSFFQNSPLYCEETDYAKSALSDLRVRPDHFKGFSPKRSRAIIDANASVAAEKELLMKMEQDREQQWAVQQAETIAKMEEIEMTRNALVEEENKIEARTLKAQREELKEKQRKMEEDKFGAIGLGFFQKFGTSCR
jgi:hypothetical protein